MPNLVFLGLRRYFLDEVTYDTTSRIICPSCVHEWGQSSPARYKRWYKPSADSPDRMTKVVYL